MFARLPAVFLWGDMSGKNTQNNQRPNQALAGSEQRFDALFYKGADGIIVSDLNGLITDVNPVFCAMLGFDENELLGLNYRDITHLDCLAAEAKVIARAIAQKKEYARYEKSYVKKDGAALPISITAWVLRNNDGKAIGHIGIVRDISESKKREHVLREAHSLIEAEVDKRTFQLMKANKKLTAEIRRRQAVQYALEKSETRYRDLVENLTDIIFSTDADGMIIFVNSAVEKILGFLPEQVIGQSFLDLLPKSGKDKAMAEFALMFTDASRTSEFRVLSKSGSIICLRCTVSPWFSKGRVAGIHGIAADVTRTRMLQKELLRSERLAATGQFASFLAAEINSPLQGIMSVLSGMSKGFKNDENMKKKFGLLEGAFLSIKNTVRKLLDLDIPLEEKLHAVNVNQSIKSTVFFLESRFRKSGIRLRLHLSSRVPFTMASQKRLEYVFLNLLNNACESICGPNSGQAIDNGEINISTRRKKGRIIIQIADSGNEVCLQAPEHSFHNEKNFIGTGAGLYTSQNIIQEHGGTIKAGSAPEGGTVFTIDLPVRRLVA